MLASRSPQIHRFPTNRVFVVGAIMRISRLKRIGSGAPVGKLRVVV